MSDKNEVADRIDIETVLLCTGYRHMGKDAWGKPWGPSLLLIELDKAELRQMFYDIQGDVRVWDSVKLHLDDGDVLMRDIIMFEAQKARSFDYWNEGKHFCFAHAEERAKVILGQNKVGDT